MRRKNLRSQTSGPMREALARLKKGRHAFSLEPSPGHKKYSISGVMVRHLEREWECNLLEVGLLKNDGDIVRRWRRRGAQGLAVLEVVYFLTLDRLGQGIWLA